MGRPLTKETLNLLRPTAVVVDGGTELPAIIIRQESSTSFFVETNEGAGLCSLTAEAPQPGEMRLHAFAADESSYYVTHISKELVTVVPDTGTGLDYGNEVRWNLNTGTSQDLVLDNKTYCKWLSIDGNDTGIWGFHINPDKSIYSWGYDAGNYNSSVMKISAQGNLEWATLILQGPNTPGAGFGGLADSEGNVYTTNISNSGDTYFAKLNSQGELLWQKQTSIYPYFGAISNYAYLDSQKNLYATLTDNITSTVLKVKENGELEYQKDLQSPIGYGNYVNAGCVLSDDSLIITPGQALQASPFNDGTVQIFQLAQNGDIINNFAYRNSIDSYNHNLSSSIVIPTINSELLIGGQDYNIIDNKSIATFLKVSLDGTLLWQRGYTNNIDPYPGIVDARIDKDYNIYTVTSVYSKTVITKWTNNGDMVWQRLVANNDSSLRWNFTITSMQIIENHIYLEFYHQTGPIYDQQFIIRLNIDNPEIGSFTEPYQYTITDAMDDGWVVTSSNIIMTTSNISIVDSNYAWTNTAFAQENININYELGY